MQDSCGLLRGNVSQDLWENRDKDHDVRIVECLLENERVPLAALDDTKKIDNRVHAQKNVINEIKSIKVDDSPSEGEGAEEDEGPRAHKFSVTNPVKVGGHVVYTVTGMDGDGDFSEVRRFREFYALGEVLRTRWPGCYVPSIPEKKLVNQKSDQFVEERRSLLERFMKEISKYDYILFSKEFKIFSRGKGEIDKVLYSLDKQTPMQVLEKYRLNFKIDEEQDSVTMNKYGEKIMLFQAYLKKAIGIMEMQKKQMKLMMNARTKHDKN